MELTGVFQPGSFAIQIAASYVLARSFIVQNCTFNTTVAIYKRRNRLPTQ